MSADSRPVFVLGTPFSGAGILSWGLAQHPNLTHALETKWLVKLASDLESLHAMSIAEPNASRLAVMATGRSRFYEAFGAAVNDLFVANGSPGRPPQRWIDCTPGHAPYIAGLLRLFPGAQFIHVLRDVTSVVKALVHRPSADGSCYSEESAYEYWLRTAKSILEAELAFGSERILRVRRADLGRDAARTLERCLDFLGEPFSADCLRPFNGLDDGADGSDLARYEIRTSLPIRQEAELLSGVLLQESAPRPERIAQLDEQFGRAGRREDIGRASWSLVQRVRDAACNVLPADATVLVLSKGDEELLKLGTRKASHFPQNAEGLYAGFHPQTSDDAIAHLEDLRNRGHRFLLVPGPHFWWLEFYREFAAHLHSMYRVMYYQEDTCLIFGLERAPRGWSAPLTIAADGDEQWQLRFGTGAGRGTAAGLGRKLWGGFSTYAKADLEELCRSSSAPVRERIDAAWELARWHAVGEDVAETLRCLRLVADLDGSAYTTRKYLLLEIDAHLRLGNVGDANALISLGVSRYGYDTDLCLLASNALIERSSGTDAAHGTDAARLALINRVFARHRLLPVWKRDPRRPLALDNISSCAPHPPLRGDVPKISIVMPAHNAATTIDFALASLREQTWSNLEVLVVDDASTDGTRDVVSAIAAADPRVRLIALEENSGAYVARNKGLEQAAGEYLMVHDADDWSHAQRLETQITHLLENGLVGSVSYLARVSRNLRFNGPWRPRDKLLEENCSSLMLRTDVVRMLGGWDPVRTGADTEFRLRVEAKYGKSRVPTVMSDTPWSFALDDGGSLTRRRATHISTLYFGLRQAYCRSYQRWHAAAVRSGDFHLDSHPRAERRFPAPAQILSTNDAAREYDRIFVCDCALPQEAFARIHDDIAAAVGEGGRVGVFHWPAYDLEIDRPFDERLAALIDAFEVDVIVADQTVTTRHLIFHGASNLAHRIDRVPAVSFANVCVIAEPAGDGGTACDPALVRATLQTLFGSAGEWVFRESETCHA